MDQTSQKKPHYVCYGGCEGVSDAPGNCRAEDCPDYGKPLHECDCEDGEHFHGLGPEVEESESKDK